MVSIINHFTFVIIDIISKQIASAMKLADEYTQTVIFFCLNDDGINYKPPRQKSVTRFTTMPVINLVTPTAAAKLELLFNKLAIKTIQNFCHS
jgi:hypothetical protein